MSRTINVNLVDRLREKIQSGGYDQTAFLPPELKLASEYQVGRGMLRGALYALCKEKLLYHIPNRGFRIFEKTERRLKKIILRMGVPLTEKGREAIGILAGVCEGAARIFAEVILSTPQTVLQLKVLKERYNSGDIQGIIFLEEGLNLDIGEVIRQGIPCVVANLESNSNYPCVQMNYRDVGRLAGQELIRRGYRRPAIYMGPLERFIYKEMKAGFRGALAEEEMYLPSDFVLESSDPRTCSIADVEAMLSLPDGQRPDSVFSTRDYRAAEVFEVCAKLGLRIPEDIGVISYDNISWGGNEAQGLTTIAEEVSEIGIQSVLQLQRQYVSREGGLATKLPCRLIERTSLRPPIN